MKKILVLLFFANFAITGLYGDSENQIKQLKYVRGLNKGDAPSGDIYTFPLDLNVYENSKGSAGNFRDLRIFSGEKSQETPYTIRKQYYSATKKIRERCTSKVLSLKKLPDNQIEVIVENKDKKLVPSFLTIKTPDRNYDKQISIQIAKDSGFWNLRNMNAKSGEVVASIFDYSAIIDLKNNTVKLPKGEGRYYRIIISNFSETKFSKRMEIIEEQRGGKEFSEIKKKLQSKDDFRIDEIILEAEVSRVIHKKEETQEVETKVLEIEQEDKKTVVTIDVFRQPVIKLKLITDSVNFSRNVMVYSSNDQKKWNYLMTGNISKVSIGDFQKSDLDLELPEVKQKYLLLKIDNGDGPRLQDIKLQCYSCIYNIEFLSPSLLDSIKVYYGGNLDSPKYDIDKILGRLENPGYTSLSLESEKNNPLYSEEAIQKPFLENRYLLYIVIGIMVILLGAGLFKTIKKIDEDEIE